MADNASSQETTNSAATTTSAGGTVEEEVVMITDSENNVDNMVELEVDPRTKYLSLKALQLVFKNATGLKYRNPTTNAFRICKVDDTGEWVLPPTSGWGTGKYIVIQPEPVKRSADYADDVEEYIKRNRIDVPSAAHSSSQVVGQEETDDTYIRDLIITGIPFSCDDDAIREAFSEYGDIEMVEHKLDPATGKRRGFGFIRFKDVDVQQQILQKKFFQLGDREVKVTIPVDKNVAYIGIDGNTPNVASQKFFVGRLSRQMNEPVLRKFFNERAKEYNPKAEVTDVYIPDPWKGYAFVTLNSAQVAQKILSRKNYILDGHAIFVNPAVQKNAQAIVAGGGGGNPYGYAQAQGPAPWGGRSGHPDPRYAGDPWAGRDPRELVYSKPMQDPYESYRVAAEEWSRRGGYGNQGGYQGSQAGKNDPWAPNAVSGGGRWPRPYTQSASQYGGGPPGPGVPPPHHQGGYGY